MLTTYGVLSLLNERINDVLEDYGYFIQEVELDDDRLQITYRADN